MKKVILTLTLIFIFFLIFVVKFLNDDPYSKFEFNKKYNDTLIFHVTGKKENIGKDVDYNREVVLFKHGKAGIDSIKIHPENSEIIGFYVNIDTIILNKVETKIMYIKNMDNPYYTTINLDKMMVIKIDSQHFEKDFYSKHNMSITYLGHPLLDEIKQFKAKNNSDLWGIENDRPLIALLPGSRKQEIKRKLPLMLAASAHFLGYTRVVACAPNLDLAYYEKFKSPNVQFIQNQTYALLQKAEIALVTSGTATLETALFEVPQVVCYKSSFISFWIAKKLVKIKFISLVNLILNKEIVCELIQETCNEENIVTEINKIKIGGSKHEKIKLDYKVLIELLGKEGASARIAEDMLKNLCLIK